MARNRFQFKWPNMTFFVLCLFIGVVFLTGGGSRSDISSLLFLRPFAFLVLGFAVYRIRLEDIKRYRFLFIFAAVIIFVVAAHLIPLPPKIWHILPGRGILIKAENAANIVGVWRPLAMDTQAAWNAFFSLSIPLAVLFLVARLDRDHRSKLLIVVLIIGFLSGLLGLIQIVSDPRGPMYLYQITNNGSAVGFFANRNHHGIFLACLFPMLAVFASTNIRTVEQARIRAFAAIICSLVLIPLLLVTGSRNGLILGAIGLASIPFLYKKPKFDRPAKRKVRKKNTLIIGIMFGGIGITLLTMLMSRAQAIDRLLSPDRGQSFRFQVWGPIFDMARKYFPIGSGAGSFVNVYKIDEPQEVLTPFYLNHAHNDWLELLMTGGLPFVGLMTIASLAWLKQSIFIWRTQPTVSRDVSFARLGTLLIGMLGFASFFEYPLRIPSLASFFVIACFWAYGISHDRLMSPSTR
jgi:O-Antigen ligase